MPALRFRNESCSLIADLVSCARDCQIMKSLPDIQVPAPVIVGGDDTPFLADADYMAAKIPNARKSVVPRAGHAANLDKPEIFNQVAAEFLESFETT